MRLWLWRRGRKHVKSTMDYPRRLADGDTVPVDGYRERWQQRINRAMTEPTQELPTASPSLVRPFVNAAKHRWWRS